MKKIHKPSAKHLPFKLLKSWLDLSETYNKYSFSYTHILIRQKDVIDPGIWNELFVYIDHAHEGARQAIRAPLEDSLHPLNHNTEIDPAFGYPHKLNDTALKGFFGEILAGILAENYINEGGFKWEVPAYLFRTHIVGFQQLEHNRQTNIWDRQIVGRTGDDGLAFARDKEGRIIAWMACEAKCTSDHSSTLINDNHKKLSMDVTIPIDLLRLINALKDYRDDDYRKEWIDSLIQFYYEGSSNSSPERYDFSMYICGRCPIRSNTWISTVEPNKHYTGRRNLTSAEFHCIGVDKIIQSIYAKMESSL